MLQIKITAEAITDMAFVQNDLVTKCVKGLPDCLPLLDVWLGGTGKDVLTFLYDDGKEGMTRQYIERVAVVNP